MNKLPDNVTNGNYTSVLVKRTDKAALYKRTDSEGRFANFEVFAIKAKNGSEIYPSTPAYGVWAWCPLTEDRAETYFERINSGETVIPDVDPVTGEVNHGPDVALDDMPDVNADPNIPRPVPVIPPLISETPVSMVEDTAVAGSAVPTGWDIVAPPTADVPVVAPTVDGGAVVEVAKVRKNRVTATLVVPSGEFTKVQFAEANGLQEGNAYVKLMKEIDAKRIKLVRSEKLTAGRGRPTAIYAKA